MLTAHQSFIVNVMASNRLKLNPDKTDFLWTGSSKRLMKLNPSDHVLNLDSQGSCTVTSTNSARLLGVSVTPDLSLLQHAIHVGSCCFWQLRQIRSVRRSLDDEATATLVHAFVSNRVDYCCSLLVGSPKVVTDRFQRVLNAAARVVTNTRKYDRGLHHTMRHELHWLDMTERVFSSGLQLQFIVVSMAWLQNISLNCVLHRPSSRYQLRSSQTNQLTVPLVKLSTYGPHSFFVAGPTIWNNLPEYMRDPELSIDNFRRQLKTFLFAEY